MSSSDKVRLVLMSESLFHELGAESVTWGTPVEYVQGRPVYAPTAFRGERTTASAKREPVKERARKPSHKGHRYTVDLFGGWEACPGCWEVRRVRA